MSKTVMRLCARRLQGHSVSECVYSCIIRSECVVGGQDRGPVGADEVDRSAITGRDVVVGIECRHNDGERPACRRLAGAVILSVLAAAGLTVTGLACP